MSPLKRIYEPAAYAAGSLDGCWWPETTAEAPDHPALEGEVTTEFAVIGAGYAGLNAALALAEAGARTVVIDEQAPGWGASGRNGGFCCLGGAKAGGETIARRHGTLELSRHRATEKAAIAHVEALTRRFGIDIDRHSRGELQIAHSARAFKGMQGDLQTLRAAYGVEVELIGAEEMAGRGLQLSGLSGPMHGALWVDLGFALNPRKYALGLARAATAAGVRIHAGTPALSITPEGQDYRITTPKGTLRTRHILLTTNGYSSENLPRWMASRYLPMQSSVIVTRPLTEAEIAAQGWSSDLMAYDSRHLLHYFRLMPDRRMLFGMRGALRWTPEGHAAIRAGLRAHFDAMFPAWRGVETPHFWSGLVAMSRNLTPYVGPLGDWPRAHAAFAWHGNGVAMGSYAGAQLAARALGRPTTLPHFYAMPPRRFELGPARRAMLAAALVGYRLADAL